MYKSILFSNLKIKAKMMLVYSLVFLLTISIAFGIVYYNAQNLLVQNVERELKIESILMKSIIETAIDTSIKNSLRTTSEVYNELARYYYNLYQNGELTESEAKAEVIKLMTLRKIGTTGYIYILDSNGILKHHPKPELLNEDISEFKFIQNQISNKEGYIEYMWQNPDDIKERPKALYMSYFAPWDWIISASSYREEFLQLIEISDFEKDILDIQFGESGYPTLIDNDGTFLIHPEFKGVNLVITDDEQGKVIDEVIQKREGIIEYEWKNPTDTTPRKKLTVFSEVPEFNWVIAATSYKDEFYKPLKEIRNIFIIVFSGSLLIMLPMTLQTSKMITNPIKFLESKVKEAAKGDLSIRINLQGSDEIYELSKNFNSLIESLDIQKKQLKNEIEKKDVIAEKLVVLNEHLEELVDERTSELKEAQNKIIRNEKFLAMSKLVNDVAHVINTPLGVSITSATYINREIVELKTEYEENKLNKRVLEVFFDEIEESHQILMNNLTKVADFVVAFKLLTSNEIRFEKTHFNVKEQIEDSIVMCLGANSVSNPSINVVCPNDIELYNSEKHFNLIISNLIINADKHAFKVGDEGHIDIFVESSDDLLRIVIKDDGIGISKTDINKIFDPLYKDKYNGDNIGLGLSIVYNIIVNILDGNISAESDGISGTSFIIELPHSISG